jgi:hypothetical protein
MYWTPVVVGLGSIAAVSAGVGERAIGDVLAGAPGRSFVPFIESHRLLSRVISSFDQCPE